MNELQNIPLRFKYYVLDYLDSHDKRELFEITFGLPYKSKSVNELTEEEFWHLYQLIVDRDLDENAKQFKNETARTYKERLYERWFQVDKHLSEVFPEGLFTKKGDQEYGASIIVSRLIREGYEVREERIKEHDVVELIENVSPEYRKGDKGTVVHIYPGEKNCEVEFINDVATVSISQIKKVKE